MAPRESYRRSWTVRRGLFPLRGAQFCAITQRQGENAMHRRFWRSRRRTSCGLLTAVFLAALVAGFGIATPALADQEPGGFQQQDLFVSGRDGYHTYRIPALIVSKKGTLLAFCEGRKNGNSDSGKIDLLLKRSADNGKTWSGQQIVWADAENTCGNPCPVVDEQTGVIWLLWTWNRGDDDEAKIIAQTSKNSRRVFVTSSEDDGITWLVPQEITKDTKAADWTWYATGPGNGIQLTRGAHKGRLVIPCDHILAKGKQYYSHVIYSDDHGNTWRLGGSSPQDQVNECTVVELDDGRLLLNMRNYDKSRKVRQVCVSRDGGTTWEGQGYDETLIEPICQAGVLRYTWPEDGGKNRILFSNPASTRRMNLTVRISYNEGKSWPAARSLCTGPGAYSCLAKLPDGTIACFFETGTQHAYEKIVLALFTLDWLSEGRDSLRQ
jgi:sialidase-1